MRCTRRSLSLHHTVSHPSTRHLKLGCRSAKMAKKESCVSDKCISRRRSDAKEREHSLQRCMCSFAIPSIFVLCKYLGSFFPSLLRYIVAEGSFSVFDNSVILFFALKGSGMQLTAFGLPLLPSSKNGSSSANLLRQLVILRSLIKE